MHSPFVVRRGSMLFSTMFAAALLVASVPAIAHAQAGGIAVGTAAPGAAVSTLDGAATNLSDLIGKTPVVMEFWATWCPLCKQLEPAMAEARKKYAGKVTFVSVGVSNNQSAEKQKAYAVAHAMEGVMVFDADNHAVKAYAAPHTSFVVAVDKAGKVVYTGVGGEQNIESVVALAMSASGAMK
ncbi:MAG: TlpA disulfide reductase family protein [bacterium]